MKDLIIVCWKTGSFTLLQHGPLDRFVKLQYPKNLPGPFAMAEPGFFLASSPLLVAERRVHRPHP